MAIEWNAGMHWSYTEKAWIGLFARCSNQRVLLRHELTFIRTTPEDAARKILSFCRDRTIELGSVVAQPELWPTFEKARGESISETFSRAGLPLRKGDGDRINRWSRLRSWLAARDWPDGTHGPSLLIHPECRYFLRTLPTLVSDDTKPDDVQKTPDEYPAAGASYYAMSRPAPWIPQPTPAPGPGTWGHELAKYLQPQPSRPFVGSSLVDR